MKLRNQIFLVSLLLLSLPWAGCQYLQAVDTALRDLQATSLTTNARSLADRFVINPNLFASPYTNVRQGSRPLYSVSLNSRPIIDGYQDDWRNYGIKEKTFVNEDQLVTLTVGDYQKDVYFFIKVRDDQLRYFNPSQQEHLRADHLAFHFYKNQVLDKTVYLYTSSPGNLIARYRDQQNRLRDFGLIKGVWRENTEGYQLELEVDRALLSGGFEMDIIDSRLSYDKRIPIHTLNDPDNQYKKFELIMLSRTIQQELASLNLSDVSVTVLNREKYRIASIKAADQDKKKRDTPWFIEWIYRQSLDVGSLPLRSQYVRDEQWSLDGIDSVNQNEEKILWYRIPSQILRDQTAVGVVIPLRHEDDLLGFLVLEKTTDRLLALTSSAFNRLFLFTSGIFVLVALGLIVYASWLSWRISRLNRATHHVIGDQGLIIVDHKNWPEFKSSDELGDLSRSYKDLLLRLRESQDYLRGLSSKLSHELRTPIAIVRSSLDNIVEVDDIEQQRQYHQRAQQGIERLSMILNAMSSANRIEESLATAEFSNVDLSAFLSALSDMYNDAYTPHSIQFIDEAGPVTIPLAQELFAQLMDKLVDNARGFSAPEDPIVIRLLSDKNLVTIRVENKGPLLPETMRGRLFDSMISVRAPVQGPTKVNHDVHLGLGLYIVRLVTLLHQGQVFAENQVDETGVIVSVTLSKTE